MTFRILHTADWHLGQKFIGQNRDAEQRMALDWLLVILRNHAVDCLIVAGDIFDVNNPPISAEEMYYRFLTQVKDTGCRHVVIIGGNHDSPAKLNAPKGLLRALNVHVIGAAGERIEDEILELRNDDGQLEAVVAAVPFLRDKDFNFSGIGESVEARIQRIKDGILSHYQTIATRIEQNPAYEHVPVIATGHLFARGASASEEQNNIYIGNLDNISAEAFSEVFDYVALGHIHRPQIIAKQNRIRYSGSLIPLSFSEVDDKKSVTLVEWLHEPGEISNVEHPTSKIQNLFVPVFRPLIRMKGSMSEIERQLQALDANDSALPAWLEIIVTGEIAQPSLSGYLREYCTGLHAEILKIRHERSHIALSEQEEEAIELSALSADEVFDKLLDAKGIIGDERKAMALKLRELTAWMNEEDA